MSPTIVLTGGRVWDGSAQCSAERTIAFADGVVLGEIPAEGRRVDISGCTVIPGLIEGHAHLCFNARADWRHTFDTDGPEHMLLRMANAAQRMLAAGITTVRDLGGPTPLAIALRDAIRDGLATGPDLLVAGAPITTTGGHCHFMGGEADGELGFERLSASG